MLRRLVRSLAVEAATADFELIVVDQSADLSAEEVLAQTASAFPWTVCTSARGVSRGRNRGLAEARAPYVTFPDDDAWYPGTTIRRVLEVFAARPDLIGVSTMLWDGGGRPNMLRWSATPQLVSRRNHYRTSIGSTMFARTVDARAIAGFDENVGVGSGTPYGSCEDSDFVVRLLETGPIAYRPDLGVHHDAMHAMADMSAATKMYSYGAGQAWFWKRHRFNPLQVAYLLGRKASKVGVLTLTGSGDQTTFDRQFLRGVFDGFTGRVRSAHPPLTIPPPA